MENEIEITDSKQEPLEVSFESDTENTILCQYGLVFTLSELQACKLAKHIMNHYYGI